VLSLDLDCDDLSVGGLEEEVDLARLVPVAQVVRRH
jgi:hypothetical protein